LSAVEQTGERVSIGRGHIVIVTLLVGWKWEELWDRGGNGQAEEDRGEESELHVERVSIVSRDSWLR
jgi:hypothetical protein